MKGRLRTVLNWTGVGLLVLCYALSLGRAFLLRHRDADSRRVTLRIAHWQLEAGMRGAVDDLAAAYTRLHPEVTIEQLPIPESVYGTWLITQLIGGTAPDLIQIGGMPDEYYARYFVPLTESVDEPNPYDDGTPLAGKPWRETFLDGLASTPAYNAALLDYYGVGLGMNTIRLFYNKDLYAAALGADAPPPRTYGELIDACRGIEDYARKSGHPLIPIAGSSYNGPMIMYNLFSSQTQKLAQRLDPTRDMSPLPERMEVAAGLAYLAGRWNLHDPAVLSGLSIMSEVAGHMQPGFMQVSRDDATFYFLQQRAVMMATGGWDLRNIAGQARFRLGICRIPLPAPDDPRYGQFVLGPFSEAATSTGAVFGLTRRSTHPEQALDFLRFAASWEGDRIFSRASHWLPAVEQVPIPEEVRDFAPVFDGYPGGTGIGGGPETGRLVANGFYLLTTPGTPVESFVRSLEAGDYRAAIVSDLQLGYKTRRQNLQRDDSAYGAVLRLRGDPAAARKLAALDVQQNETEILNLRVARGLSAAGAPLRP